MNSASVSEANALSEKTATNNKSSAVATVLTPATSENSRMSCCVRDKNGSMINSMDKKMVHSVDADVTTCHAGRSLARPSAQHP